MAERIFDTDVLIDALRRAPDTRRRVAAAGRLDRLFTTTVTVFELDCGANTDRERDAVRGLLENFRVLPLDEECATAAAGIDRQLRAIGSRLEIRDTLIAGIARAHGMELVTRNFARVPGLVVSGL